MKESPIKVGVITDQTGALSFMGTANANWCSFSQGYSRCFRSLLLVTCLYLCLAKALVPDLQPTNSGDAKYQRAHLHRSTLHLSSTNNLRKHP